MVERFELIVDFYSKDILDSGFENMKKMLGNLQGDHSTSQRFTNLEAEDVAQELFNKYKGKIHQIAIR